MKNLPILSLLLISLFSFGQKKEAVKGSKIVKVITRPISNFESIEVEDNFDVFLVKGNECGFEIESDDNLFDFIETKSVGTNLRISSSKNITGYKKLSIRVTYTDNLKMVISKDETNVTALADVALTNVTFKSYDHSKLFLYAKTNSFTLMLNDKSKAEINLVSDKTAIDLSNNASLKALITSKDLKFDMYQKSTAEIEGDTNDFKLRMDNSSDFIGKKLTSKNAFVEINNDSECSVNAITAFTLSASGDSKTDLYGEPSIDIKRFSDSAVLRKKPIK